MVRKLPRDDEFNVRGILTMIGDHDEAIWKEFAIGDVVIRISDAIKYMIQSINVDFRHSRVRSKFILLDLETHKLKLELDGYWLRKEWIVLENLIGKKEVVSQDE